MNKAQQDEVLAFISAVPTISLTNIFQYAIMFAYSLNRQVYGLSDIIMFAQNEEPHASDSSNDSRQNARGNYAFEAFYLKLVEDGNLQYKELLSNYAAIGDVGKLSNQSALQNAKNTCIATVTLCSRAAMRGGLPPETAYSMSNFYIQAIDSATSISEVYAHNSSMLDDYIHKVHDYKALHQNFSKMIADADAFISLHLTEDISIESIARELGYSKYYFSAAFKKSTGKTVNEYIRDRRLEYAKMQLLTSDEKISQLSERLHFISPSYFTKCFKAYLVLTKEQEKFIDQHVDSKYYSISRLKRYLSVHTIVGNEVFSYCDRRLRYGDRPTYAEELDDSRGFEPVSVNVFVRRIPFYFYVAETIANLHFLFPSKTSWDEEDEEWIDGWYSEHQEDVEDDDEPITVPTPLDFFYSKLEFLYYDCELPVADIIRYPYEQRGLKAKEAFEHWFDYVAICKELGCTDLTPKNFISKYNELLEAHEEQPIIYQIRQGYEGEAYSRCGNKFYFRGDFPLDDEGNPIMRWIGISVINVESITFEPAEYSVPGDGVLIITVTPESIIDLLTYETSGLKPGLNHIWAVASIDLEDFCLERVYTGPLAMQFNAKALKAYRSMNGLTQQEVADAVGASVRTYQKWENGTTIPDGHYLIRLMNWLDIPSVQELTEYK